MNNNHSRSVDITDTGFENRNAQFQNVTQKKTLFYY